MSAHTATQTLLGSSDVGIVEALPGNARTRLRIVEKPSATQFSPVWLPQSNAASTSRIGKGGAFVLVLLIHVVAFVVLANMKLQPVRVDIPPTQVVILAEQHSKLELPPPPQPKLETPQFDVPLVPIVLDIVDPQSTSITVAEQPTEAAPASSGAPKLVSTVEYIREPAAKYPPAARALKQRGTVTLRALIDAEGHARDVDVHRSSGYRLLDDAARTAVFNALFKPYRENGRSIPVYVFIPIEFDAARS